jgi:hypothetical protein
MYVIMAIVVLLLSLVVVAYSQRLLVFGIWYLPHLSVCQWAEVLCSKY